MLRPVILAGLAIVAAAAIRVTAPIFAQSGLAELGLTEAQARAFLLEEMKSETGGDRRSSIAVAGHRAFQRLPPVARGPAASALFAWARAYVGSPDFQAAYAEFRREANPLDTRTLAVDEQVATEMAAMLESIEEARKMAETLPPADRDQLLAAIADQEAQMSEFRERLAEAIALEQSERTASNRASADAFEEQFPADPNRIVARRLRAFLDETADADFTARIIRLTDGPDGMEFVEPAHRARSVTWQLAVLAGPEATGAARAAAENWLMEIEP